MELDAAHGTATHVAHSDPLLEVSWDSCGGLLATATPRQETRQETRRCSTTAETHCAWERAPYRTTPKRSGCWMMVSVKERKHTLFIPPPPPIRTIHEDSWFSQAQLRAVSLLALPVPTPQRGWPFARRPSSSVSPQTAWSAGAPPGSRHTAHAGHEGVALVFEPSPAHSTRTACACIAASLTGQPPPLRPTLPDAGRGLDSGDSAGVSEPLLDLLDAVFELQTRGFFRRQVQSLTTIPLASTPFVGAAASRSHDRTQCQRSAIAKCGPWLLQSHQPQNSSSTVDRCVSLVHTLQCHVSNLCNVTCHAVCHTSKLCNPLSSLARMTHSHSSTSARDLVTSHMRPLPE